MKHGSLLFLTRGLVALMITVWSLQAHAQVFAPLRNQQEDRARLLTDQLRFAEAYPYWANLAELAEREGGPSEPVRAAMETAMASEQYGEALRWLEALRAPTLNAFTTADAMVYVELLKRTGAHARVPKALMSFRADFPGDSALDALAADWPQVEAMLADTGEAVVKAFRPSAEAEEYGAVPWRGGLAFITRGVANGVSVDGWMNQPWTKVAFIPDTAEAEPRHTDLDQWLNRDLFNGLDQTLHHDGHIAFSPDREVIAITRNQTLQDTLRTVKRSALELVFFERILGKDWREMKPFDHNDPHWSTGHAAFTPEGDLIFASDRPGGFGGADLWRCEKKGSGWLEPVNLGPTVNSGGDELFPFMADDSTLYFASNGWPGLGGLDVFSWIPRAQRIEHLPIPVNSSADDFALYVEADGSGFLSSNRGDWVDRIYELDMPMADATWELVVQSCDTRPIAGVPMEFVDETSGLSYEGVTNASGRVEFKPRYAHRVKALCGGNDTLVAVDGALWANVEGGLRQDTITLNWRNPEGSIVVLDGTNAPLTDALITFTRADGTVKRGRVGDAGTYFWNTTTTLGFERVEVDALNFESASHALAGLNGCARPERYRFTLELKEEEIDLANIFYDLNKADLRPLSVVELDKLVRYMNQRPTLRVELSSHTDCRNSDEYNQDLSQRRAQSCVDYIISQGISPDRIVARGYGESRLMNSCGVAIPCEECKDEVAHQANRRTEVKLLVE